MKFVLFIVLVMSGVHAYANGLSDYKLGAGDVIRIFVYEEPELSFEVKLSDAGTLSYPFLGELIVSGKTVSELELIIDSGLRGDYLVEPSVNVSVVEYRQFFVNGEVERPGGFAFQPGLTLRKAVALAGGFTERASRNKIYVIRDIQSEDRTLIKLDEDVFPGDIITVEQSFF